MTRWLNRLHDAVHPARSATKVSRPADAQAEVGDAAQHLVLYHFPTCPYCLRVRRAIDRLDLPIRLRDINRDPEARRELIAGGGRPTVPCLRIDGDGTSTWMYESNDIVRYLEDRFRPD